MTNNSTDFSKLRNDLIAKFEYMPKDPKYIPTVYKLIETNNDVRTIFMESLEYNGHIRIHSKTFHIIFDTTKNIYKRFKAANIARKIFKIVDDLTTSKKNCIGGDYENLWFSMFKEMYEKQDNSVDKLKAVLSLVNFFTLCIKYGNTANFNGADYISIRNEFIEIIDTYYYKKESADQLSNQEKGGADNDN